LSSCLRASCRAALNATSFSASVSWARINDELRSDFFDVPALAGRSVRRRGFSVIDGFQLVHSPIDAAMWWRLTKPMVLGSMLEDSAMYFANPTVRHWPENYFLEHVDNRLSAGGASGADLRLTCSLIEFSRRLATANGTEDVRFYRYLMSTRPVQPVMPHTWSQFPTQAAFGGFDLMQLLGRQAASREQSAAWQARFGEFVRTGRISGWESYDSAGRRLVNLVDGGAAPTATADPRADLCDWWKTKLPDLHYRGWYA
uniref:COesterase domain-containing protein n=1 Tax=Macrostomum lignano TaxID=282301 RepID=A0A1I8GYI6_9PLAT